MSYTGKTLNCASALALLFAGVLGAAPAFAADAAAPATPAADNGQIQEVVVQARKISENVQLVPVPITVVGAQALERQNLTNFTDFQFKFPAFSVYLTNPKQLNLGVRGIGNNGFNTDGIDGSVGVFVDGVYSGRPGMVSGDFSDIEQVDLLRGPQGTLFGKNTTAGAVIINSQKPSFDTSLNVEAGGGSEGLQEYKVNLTGPLVEDKLAFRIAGFYNMKNGNYPNLSGSAANAREGSGVRLQFLATPTSDFSFRLIAAIGQQAFNTISPVTLGVATPTALQARMSAAGYTLFTGGNASNREININGTLNAVTHNNFVSGEANYDLGKMGQLTSITAFEAWNCYTNNDNDYTQLDALNDYGSCNAERQFSQELRWAYGKGGPIESVVGAFYSDQELVVGSRVKFGSQYYIWAANPSTTAFPNKSATQTWASGAYTNQVTGAGITSQGDFHTDTQAIFGNVNYHPDADRRWSIDLGLRQTWESKSMNYNGAVTSNPGGLSQAQLNIMSTAGANAQLGTAQDAVTDSSLSGQASVSYRITDNVMGYVSFARGYKSKGFNLLPENASNPDPNVALAIKNFGASQDIKGETTDNWEGGFKTEWFNRRAMLNLTVFDTMVYNAQANESIGVGNTATKFLANVGSERSLGAELEGQARLFDGLKLTGFLGYDEATYASFHNSACPAEAQFAAFTSCDLTGKQVAWAPKWTSDLTVEYDRSFYEGTSQYAIFDVNWRSEQNTTIILDPAANIDPYALLGLRVGSFFKHDTIEAQLWVTNLLNTPYYINLLGLTKATGIVQGYPGNPREFGGTLRMHF